MNALKGAGLRLITRNFHVRGGEIDLVMRDGDTIVFVEVRQRSLNDYGYAIETISNTKVARIRHAAALWLAKEGKSDWPCRFDVYCIDGSGRNAATNWIKGAF